METTSSSASPELRGWRHFMLLAETLHYGRAAQRLHITQPALTQSILQLEARVGERLFERGRRGVALSVAGAALVEPVRSLLAAAAALPAAAREAAAGSVGRLRLAFVSTIGFGPLPGWLRGFRQAQPGVGVELIEATADVQLRAFERGELDAGFVLHAPEAPPAGLASMAVLDEALWLALPEAHPLAASARLAPAAVLSEPLVLFPRAIAPSLFDTVLALYQRHGLQPTVAQQAIQMQTIVNLVSAGLGLAWVPATIGALQRPGVVYRPAPRALEVRVRTSLVWRAEPLPPPALARFIDFVRAHPAPTPRRSAAV
ncbi:LysR family transcriptional regulator [Rivibacter subsaxonicus]|uniref:DNA-binding transcriptional LysR family regulator n=1 Tax=Rivibacter subsaxonicus TaxID=457575 RepID=A0A4Q7VA66_9BURK|nr:LysR family transcriptional regulator [Rivibacter subsaxonicus]RZT93656.1 DNA-binding transcriptional LysR family regulator [Rivibacter subsaxonicus]